MVMYNMLMIWYEQGCGLAKIQTVSSSVASSRFYTILIELNHDYICWRRGNKNKVANEFDQFNPCHTEFILTKIQYVSPSSATTKNADILMPQAVRASTKMDIA